MKATNILIHGVRPDRIESVDTGRLNLVLVDLDGLRKKRRADVRDELRAMARLSFSADLSPHITLADRARFLKAYLTCYGSGSAHWKTLWRQIQKQRQTRFQDHIPG